MYKIKKQLNRVIFLGTISGLRSNPWNVNRSKFWLNKSGGPLSGPEKATIHHLCLNFNTDNYNIIEAMAIRINSKQFLKELGKEFDIKQIEQFKNALGVFNVRFEKLWLSYEGLLKKVKVGLTANNKQVLKALADINFLTGQNLSNKKYTTPVYLTISSEETNDLVGWFSWFGNQAEIILENVNVEAEKINFLSAILAHEFFHISIRRNNKLADLIGRKATDFTMELQKSVDGPSPLEILEEVLISTFSPEGYLAHKYFNQNVQLKKTGRINNDKNLLQLRRYCALKMKTTAADYTENNRCIDENYLNILFDLIKNR